MSKIITGILVLLMLLPVLSRAQADTTVIKAFFPFDHFFLSPETQQSIKEQIATLEAVEQYNFVIRGYCDDMGSTVYNHSLSLSRASEVSDFLRLNAIEPEQILEVSGLGEIAVNAKSSLSTSSQRKENRKVEIACIRIGQPINEAVVSIDKTDSIDMISNIQAGDTLIFENILFYGGRHEFLPMSLPSLDSLVYLLQVRMDLRIKILGHVCCTSELEGMDNDTGKRELSINRAKAVYQFLIDHGISADRLGYEGLGSRYPLGKGAQMDRRVEIEFLEGLK